MTSQNVKLIASTPKIKEVLYTACTTCYNPGGPIEKWDFLSSERDVVNMWSLIHKVFGSGHLSTAEHVNFTFAIEGISRACSHQLVRHRHCSFSQQSQRYVEIKESWSEIYDLLHTLTDSLKIEERNHAESLLISICKKYFTDVTKHNVSEYGHSLYWYLRHISRGGKAEDARNLLPNATKTNIVLTCNLRELMHICNERLCTRAQKEIRQLVQKMRDEVSAECPELDRYLQPKCEILGYCREHKSCGRKEILK